MCVCGLSQCRLRRTGCPPTFRYEESCVVQVRERIAVVAFSSPFLVALLTDYESCEGAIHGVIGHLARREQMDSESMHCAVASKQGSTLRWHFRVDLGHFLHVFLSFSFYVSSPEHKDASHLFALI